MAGKKKKGGFWRGLILFLFGAACGTGGIAAVAVYVNGLHLPFIKEQDKTHLPNLSADRHRSEREAVEFQDILRNRQPTPPPPTPAETATSPPPPSTTPRHFAYFLQIGAYHNRQIAEDLRGQMIINGANATINTGTLADGRTLYRVWTGPFSNEETAEEERAKLALEGYADVQLLQTAR